MMIIGFGYEPAGGRGGKERREGRGPVEYLFVFSFFSPFFLIFFSM